MGNKKQVSWTIDRELVDLIEKQAKKEKRSVSFIANNSLRFIYYKKKTI